MPAPRRSTILLALAAAAAAASPLAPRGRADTPARPGHHTGQPPRSAQAAAIAAEELAALREAHQATRGAVVVLDPRSGELLAAVGLGPDGDGQALRAVPTGSTMKALTVAAALEQGFDPARRFPGERGRWVVDGETIRDVEESDWLDAQRVLVRSSNVGAAKIAAAVGPAPLLALLERLGWRAAAGGADPALPPAEAWSGGRALALAAGLGTRASPLHLARAYAAIAGGAGPARVLSAGAALQVTAMLEASVREGTGRRAAIPGVRVAGKTGTSASDAAGRAWGHFVGFAPADAPRFVVGMRPVNHTFPG